MHLLNLTLQLPSAINLAVYGNFTSPQAQEFIVARGNVLQLLRPDTNGKLEIIISTEVFGTIRSIHPFRLTGGTHDYLLVGSDAGKIILVEVNASINQFEIRQNETFGKTGCRRITPGQYLAVDPKGRSVLIGAIEKQKFVYVMNRDASNRITISSPLEAHRSSAIHYHVIGLDVGFENPIFAALELSYSQADIDPSGQAAKDAVKTLVYYELDLGLNHVTRRWSDPVLRSANLLVSVPGGTDGPGGVLVLSESYVQYKHENHETLGCPIPQRRGNGRKNVLVVATSTHKQRDMFFVLIQSELGDLFKISLQYSGTFVQEVQVQYFDTIPVANALCITKNGFLFCASEFGNHYLFQFLSIGDGDNTAICKSGIQYDQSNIPDFTTRPLKHLTMSSFTQSLGPITQCMVNDLAMEGTPQIYTLCGRSNRSTIRILRHGLPVTEMAASGLPGIAKSVWCLRKSIGDVYDKFIVVSFEDATLVLEVGETVEEVPETGFLRDTSSLLVRLLEDDSMIQIHANGIRHVRKFQPVTEWKAPGKKIIEKCAANSRQVIISLAGGELIYFELGTNFVLKECGKLDLGFEIACMDVGNVPAQRQRFPFLAVGSWDNTVRILSLDPNDLFRQKSTLALTSHPHTLCMTYLQVASSKSGTTNPTNEPVEGDVNSIAAMATTEALFINIGLDNGVFQQARLDTITANITGSRSRFLGTKPVKLTTISLSQQHPHKQSQAHAVLALSSRSWCSYYYREKRYLTPLSCEQLTSACSFNSEHCPDGIVGLALDGTLKILTLDQLGESFNQQQMSLNYTPRKAVVHAPSKKLVMIECDHNETTQNTDVIDESIEEDEEEREEKQQALLFSRSSPPTSKNQWVSIVRLFDPVECTSLSTEKLEANERATSITPCVFHDRGGEVFIIIGSIVNMELHKSPTSTSNGRLRVYRVLEGLSLQLIHITEVEYIPYALCEFQGRLLASVGNTLRIYDLGKRKLLRKCEQRGFSSVLVDLKTLGDRIYASDMHESFHFIKYRKDENSLLIFADDSVPRFITSSVLLDYDTIAGADKFGNVFIARLRSEASDEMDNPTGNRMLWDTGLLNGAPNKLEQIAQFHVGEVVTSMVRASLVPGGMEAIIYSTIMGRVAALVPFTSKEDVDFYTHLEMYMRQEKPSLVGRDHLSYRSYFMPVRNVTDGDLCEQFTSLSYEKQEKVAEDLDRTPDEVLKKLEDIRNRLL